MTDILTESDFSLKKRSAVFSKIAFCFSIWTSFLFFIFVANITATFRPKANNPAVLGKLTLLLLLSMTLGLIFSIISLVKKEKIRHIKAIAAVVNIGLIIVILGTMIFALIMDLKNMT